MHLSNLLYVPILLTMLLSTSASLLSNPDSNPDLTNTPSPSLQPRSLGLHRDTLSNSDSLTTGSFKVYMPKSIALIPLNIAAHEMSDFFNRRRPSRPCAKARGPDNIALRLRLRRHQEVSEHDARDGGRGGTAFGLGSYNGINRGQKIILTQGESLGYVNGTVALRIYL